MKSRILINEDIVDSMPDRLFDQAGHGADALLSRHGRGMVITFEYQNQDMVLKSYHRGGLPGRLISDTYLYTGLARSRMWREFHLLRTMRNMGLPVPTPVAARCVKSSPFTYRGDLIMTRIDHARTLAESISREALPAATWSNIGAVIALFHNKRVFHRDLNAHNILLTPAEEIYLIDFDKCGFKTASPSRRWRTANLDRLNKSLRKLARQPGELHFDDDNWRQLEEGYQRRITELLVPPA